MKREFRFTFTSPNRGRGFRISGNPLVLVLVLLAAAWLCLVGVTAVRLARDCYFSYQGRVTAIRFRWIDYIALEPLLWERLTIETPEGRTIDRLVSMHRRLKNRIREGDYVEKKRGFTNYVRAVGKNN